MLLHVPEQQLSHKRSVAGVTVQQLLQGAVEGPAAWGPVSEAPSKEGQGLGHKGQAGARKKLRWQLAEGSLGEGGGGGVEEWDEVRRSWLASCLIGALVLGAKRKGLVPLVSWKALVPATGWKNLVLSTTRIPLVPATNRRLRES